jgi:hypothetical protein
VKDNKEKLHVFEKNGLYLATKKIGKNNPRAEQIQYDNEERMKWNREVDHALVSNVPEEEIRKIKKEYITDKVKDSIDFWGYRPEELADFIISAVLALKQLIQKLFYKLFETKPERDTTVIREPESIVREFENVESVRETFREPEPEPVAMEIQTAGPVGWIIGEPEHEPEATMTDIHQTELIDHTIRDEEQEVIEPDIYSIEPVDQIIREPEAFTPDIYQTEPVDQMIYEPEPEPEAQIPPRPKASEEAKAYPMLEKIKEELDKQNKIIFQAEKERNILEIERDDLRGLQVITKKASLQRQIDSKEVQIDRLKAGLSKTVQRHGFRNVKEFYNAYHTAQKACADYVKKAKEWENTYGDEATQKKSIRERLNNYRTGVLLLSCPVI